MQRFKGQRIKGHRPNLVIDLIQVETQGEKIDVVLYDTGVDRFAMTLPDGSLHEIATRDVTNVHLKTREVASYPPEDNEFADYLVDSVNHFDDGTWDIRFGGGLGFAWKPDSEDVGVDPKAGMVARMYSANVQSPVRGLFINEVQLYYRTFEEDQAYRAKRLEDETEKRKAEFLTEKDDLDARFDKLSIPMQERIRVMRLNNPNFRWQFEATELFCLEQAQKLADACGAIDALQDFAAKPAEEQAKILGEEDFKKHGPNTFTATMRMAHRILVGNYSLMISEHGALANVIGCGEYGCHVGKHEAQTA